MRIGVCSQYYTNPPAQKINFTGVLHVDPKTGNINDSWFNRDRKILQEAADEIKTTFPNGADVLIYGCSTGEENISFKMFLPDGKYRAIGYDTSADALRIGKRGVYTVFSNWYDSYLLPSVSKSQLKQNYPSEYQELLELREKFHDMMYEVPASREYKDINNKSAYISLKCENPDFVERFYCLHNAYRSQIDLRLGNFMNVGQVRKENPVGGIFFRNAIYHMCNNNVNEVLNYNALPGVFKNKNLLMDYLINGVYKTLDKGGIFVLGNHLKEHLFLTDETTPKENVVNFCDTPFYVESNKNHREHKFLKCFKESPLLQALLKGGRFEPIGFSEVTTYHCKVKVPVIFKKIR
ncbi:hypothetical protein J6P92_07325 [bacterium]|nr:hypothetical protein [bacterium]